MTQGFVHLNMPIFSRCDSVRMNFEVSLCVGSVVEVFLVF